MRSYHNSKKKVSVQSTENPPISEHFSILDIHYNSNFLGVDVKGG